LDNNNLPPDPPPDKSKPASEADQSPVTKKVRKRGRPSTIPVDRKEEVAKLMADAAARDEKFSWKEAAQILYQTNNPTALQCKNAANFMTYYLKSRRMKSGEAL
jgi:hypothetical protein